MIVLVLTGMSFTIIWEMFPGKISLKSLLLLLLVNFVSGLGLELMYTYSHIYPLKYQAKPHLPPWFSAACVAAIVHRNRSFGLYGHNQSSKVKFRQASNCCKQQKYICCISYLQQPARRYSLLYLIKQNYLLKNFL